MNRHDLVYVRSESWQSLIRARDDLPGDPVVSGWVDRGWALVGRRANEGEGQGIALGLPLPPSGGKKRLALLMQPADVVSVAPPPSMVSAIRAAPFHWQATLMRLDQAASQCGADARVFGSLAWQLITGLAYVTESSDLDFALHVNKCTPLRDLVDHLALIEAASPMRLDGELIREDGAAINWRELHSGAPALLVKTVAGIALVDTGHFLSGSIPL